MLTPKEKEKNLLIKLKSYDSLAIAYSGGVDSTYLADCAHEVLGKNALIVIADSPSLPRSELNEATSFSRRKGWNLHILETKEHLNPNYLENKGERCFHCKKTLFHTMKELILSFPNMQIAYGAVEDDKSDNRPGTQAAFEYGAIAPLQEAGLFKKDIRILSKLRKLPTANKASFACLGSRFPTGTPINLKKLKQVEKAEEILRARGYYQYRIRHHNDICRIEIEPEEFEKLLLERDEIVTSLKQVGYRFITLDLSGYQTGSTA
mgnify:CR=1 FL=1